MSFTPKDAERVLAHDMGQHDLCDIDDCLALKLKAWRETGRSPLIRPKHAS